MSDDEDMKSFAGRLRDAAARVKPQERAASMAGVAVPTWQRYLRGEREPGFLAIARFARAAQVDLQWLAYDQPATAGSPLDEELLAEIIQLVEAEADRRGSRPPPEKLAALVVHCYVEELRHAAAGGTSRGHAADPAAVRRAFRLVG